MTEGAAPEARDKDGKASDISIIDKNGYVESKESFTRIHNEDGLPKEDTYHIAAEIKVVDGHTSDEIVYDAIS